MANDADGIMLVVIGDQNGRFIEGLEQQGYEGKIATAGPFLTPAILDEVGELPRTGHRRGAGLPAGDLQERSRASGSTPRT